MPSKSFCHAPAIRYSRSVGVSKCCEEPIGWTWDMLRSSHKWTKTQARASQFLVPVAVDGTSVLKYRVRVPY